MIRAERTYIDPLAIVRAEDRSDASGHVLIVWLKGSDPSNNNGGMRLTGDLAQAIREQLDEFAYSWESETEEDASDDSASDDEPTGPDVPVNVQEPSGDEDTASSPANASGPESASGEQAEDASNEGGSNEDTSGESTQDGEAPDDLTAIKGLGPKTRDALVAAGVTTFAALAGTDPQDIRGILDGAGVMNGSDDAVARWQKEASALAA
ncbi:MAG: helix-hairpin-helix domain-containing protein [Bacteroidota bacterium]